ncbi:MAG: PKD domain-containing protein, partial [Ichthyobacteriaceae bacterium]|nr:PKD domain-containing protein [Ichthyobacteriaceae bacterium]
LANVAPVADFSYNADELSVYFTDVSTDADGSVESRNWNFGDGSTSTSQNPTHKYTVAGTYTVSLLVTDNNGATNNNQKSITVVVANKNPIAGFSFNTSDLSVAFTDNSNDTDGSISSRVWDFGDGATSSVQTPTHSYSSAGTYTVKLTVVDNDGASDTEIKTITVTEAEEVVEVIDLTARASKKRGVRIVQLNWRGADGSVTVYRNGRVVATNVSASSFSDNLGKNKGTYSYKVCASDGSSCSEEISVNVR